MGVNLCGADIGEAEQRLTVDETFVLHNVQMDRAAAYVAGGRHRDQCDWFCNRKALEELHTATDDGERLQHLADDAQHRSVSGAGPWSTGNGCRRNPSQCANRSTVSNRRKLPIRSTYPKRA